MSRYPSEGVRRFDQQFAEDPGESNERRRETARQRATPNEMLRMARTIPRLSVRRDGATVLLEDSEIDRGRRALLRVTFLNHEGAIELGRELVRLGTEAATEAKHKEPEADMMEGHR